MDLAPYLEEIESIQKSHSQKIIACYFLLFQRLDLSRFSLFRELVSVQKKS